MNAQPNILLITGDHIRHDALGCNGNSFVKTPVLDRLAADGITFCNSYSPDPICVPGRAAITTGNYPHKCTGVKANSGRIKDDQVKIAQLFADNGYRTYALGKLHYVPYAKPGEPRLLHGFQYAELCEEGRILNQFAPGAHQEGLEEYHDYLYSVGWGGYERAHGVGNNDIHPCPSPVPEEHYVDRWVADRTIAALQRHNDEADQPFFTWMSFTKPHSPYDPPEPWHRMYDPREIPAPLGTGVEHDGLDKRAPMITSVRESHGVGKFSPEMIQMARAHYYGMVSFQDDCIGRVINYLEESDQLDNTVIVYTGDHGDLLGDFGGFYKVNFLDGSARIPSVWYYPEKIKGGQKPDCLMGLQDVLPTLAGLADIELPQQVDGVDLMNILDGAIPERDVYIGQCLDAGSQEYMVCSKEYKYIYSELNGIEELYARQEDPDELFNISEKKPEITTAMRNTLITWCRENGDDSMLDGDNLVQTPFTPAEGDRFRAGSMGWRWY